MNGGDCDFYRYDRDLDGEFVGPVSFAGTNGQRMRNTFFRIAALVLLSEIMWIGTVALAAVWFPRGGWVQMIFTACVLAAVALFAVVRTVLLIFASNNPKPWTIMTARTLIRWPGGETPRLTRLFCFPPPVHPNETSYFKFACLFTTACAAAVVIAVIPLTILRIMSPAIALFAATYAASGWLAWWAWTYAGIVLPRDQITLEYRAGE